jgi:PEP-CTERM motif
LFCRFLRGDEVGIGNSGRPVGMRRAETERGQIMKTRQWVTVAVVSMIFASLAGSAKADSIIVFKEANDATSEHMRTKDFRRLCFTCKTGISGVVLFEKGTSEVSDFVIAETHLSAFGFVDTNFFFESDPDLLFFANNSPGIRMEAALLNGLIRRALAGQIPKTDETGDEQTISNLFRSANGALAPLPSDIFSGGYVVKVTSDPDVPEPSSLSLLILGFTAFVVAWRYHRRTIGLGSLR